MVANEVDAIALGNGAKAFDGWDIAIGPNAGAQGIYAIAIGGGTGAMGNYGISMNGHAQGAYSINFGGFTKKDRAITVGYAFTETSDSGDVTHTCTTEGTGSITIGAGANTLNTTAGDGTVTESSNAITIGCKASNQGADSVVIGAQAKATAGDTVAIGAGAEATDVGAVVFASHSSDRTMRTQLYFCGAGTPLAVEYYNGEAFMGYTIVDKSTGQIAACGTRRMSELFTDNTTAQPATLDEFGDWVMPKVFQPGKSEPQDYTPLPVYPIVEPEIPEEL